MPVPKTGALPLGDSPMLAGVYWRLDDRARSKRIEKSDKAVAIGPWQHPEGFPRGFTFAAVPENCFGKAKGATIM